MSTISCSPQYFLQSCLSLTLNILAAIIPVWTSIIFALMRPRMILHFDIFPAFYLASCRWPPISREQITMSIRTFLIFLFILDIASYCWHFIFGDAHICQREPNNVAQGKFLSSSNSSFAYCGNRKYSLENTQ